MKQILTLTSAIFLSSLNNIEFFCVYNHLDNIFVTIVYL